MHFLFVAFIWGFLHFRKFNVIYLKKSQRKLLNKNSRLLCSQIKYALEENLDKNYAGKFLFPLFKININCECMYVKKSIDFIFSFGLRV